MPAAAEQAARPVASARPHDAPVPRRADAVCDEEPPGIDDGAALVAAARTGDRAALSGLHERFAPVVHGILLARLPHADCDDLVQEVFLNVIRRLGTLRDDRAFPAWVSTMARNFAASFFRRRGRSGRHEAVVARIGPHGAAPPAPPPGPAPPSPRDDALAHLQAQEVLAVIRLLPEAYSETLTLRLVEGLTGPQIAARTGMSHGSVRVNLHRGMALLRERLRIGDEP
ncbi:MAG: RNA polymerase sigma factor [Phycisphaerales bacterium]